MKKLLNVKNAVLLSKQQQKGILAGFGGATLDGSDCTLTCDDGHETETSDCERGTVQNACQGHGGAQSCVGALSTCG